MSEIARVQLVRRPALARAAIGAPGSAIHLAPLPEGHILQALAAPGAGDVAGRLAQISDGGGVAIRPLSPGQWFVVGDAVIGRTELADKAAKIADIAALSDQSHGRVRIVLSGPAAETVLSRGTAVDVSSAAFPLGRSAQTLYGHIGIHLTRTSKDGFELMVLRSFAESLWDELEGLAKGYAGAA